MTTIIRYSCAALLVLASGPAGAADGPELLPSWSGVIASVETAADRSAEPTIEVSAATSVDQPLAGSERLASWSGDIPEVSSGESATTAAQADDAPASQFLSSWSGIIPTVSGR
jgi:hypothetical protein